MKVLDSQGVKTHQEQSAVHGMYTSLSCAVLCRSKDTSCRIQERENSPGTFAFAPGHMYFDPCFWLIESNGRNLACAARICEDCTHTHIDAFSRGEKNDPRFFKWSSGGKNDSR